MKFFQLILSLSFMFHTVSCQSKPNNTYNVPLLDFIDNFINKSMLCFTFPCCPIALTFDDGPDGGGGATDAIINYLHGNKIPGTFFINTKTWVDVTTDLIAQKSIKNIVEYGFNLGTHTIHHKDLSILSVDDIHNEIVGVQTTLDKFISPSPHLSLFRAPYGHPYDVGSQLQMNRVSKIAADAAYFHVAWQIDSEDYNCGKNITCVTEPIFKAIDNGQWGVILMHFVYQNTANALPFLITGLKQRKCTFFTIEQLIHAKYGKFSEEIMYDYNHQSKSLSITS
ncbi:hypothetical protein I4U23_011465 [Adineta vaga]|nr:hypothetical protein I4U23_011465 [Adineta vaga]